MQAELRTVRHSPAIAFAFAVVFGAATVVTPVASSLAEAAPEGPFAGLSGLWSGSGTVTYASGTKERLRCRVQYAQNNPDNLQQALRCASDSYKFEINAYFDSVNGKIAGNWAELTMDVKGTVAGTAEGGRIVGDLSGPGFVAQLLVTTTGNQQHVTIEADLEEIRAVDIEVRKAQ